MFFFFVAVEVSNNITYQHAVPYIYLYILLRKARVLFYMNVYICMNIYEYEKYICICMEIVQYFCMYIAMFSVFLLFLLWSVRFQVRTLMYIWCIYVGQLVDNLWEKRMESILNVTYVLTYVYIFIRDKLHCFIYMFSLHQKEKNRQRCSIPLLFLSDLE